MPPAFGAAIGNNAVSGASGTTIDLVTSGAVPAGGMVVVGVGYFLNAGTVSASGGGLSWSQAVLAVRTAPDTEYHSALFYAPAPSGLASGTTLTCTFSGSAFARMICGVYLTGTDSLDATGTGEGTNGAWSSTFTTTAAETVIVAFTWVGSVTDVNTPLTNYTEAHDFQSVADNQTAAMVYRAVSSAGSYTPGGTIGSPGGNSNIVAAASFTGATVAPAPSLIVNRSNLRYI